MVDIINNPAVALYVAAGVALVVMAGFFVYLWSVDRRLRELQRALDREAELPAREAAGHRPGSAEAPFGRPEPLRPQPIEKGAK